MTMWSAFAPFLDADEDPETPVIWCSKLFLQAGWGSYDTYKCHYNGLRLLTFCAEYSLSVRKKHFEVRKKEKGIWMRPSSKSWDL